MQIKEKPTRRDTLNGDNIMMKMNAQVMKQPHEYRLFSLTKNEFDRLPWLQYLKAGDTSFFKTPEIVNPNIPTLVEYKCEDDFEMIEEKTDGSRTPKDVIDYINDQSASDHYISVPVVNHKAEQIINSLHHLFVKTPSPINLLHINSIEMTGVSDSVIIDIFIFDQIPLTEPVRIQMTSKQISYTRFNHIGDEKIILPFPGLPSNPIFVCVFYAKIPDQATGDLTINPIAVGHCPINSGNRKQLIPVCSRFDPKLSLEEHFTHGNEITFNVVLNVSIKPITSDIEENKKFIARVSAFRNLIPTPFLIFSNFSVSLKMKNKGQFVRPQVHIKITLKRHNENQKLVEIPLYAGITEKVLAEDGCTSHIGLASENLNTIIHFPDYLPFLLSPDIHFPLFAHIEIIISKPGGTKVLASYTLPLTQSYQEVKDQKTDSKGNHISLRYTYPAIVATQQASRLALENPSYSAPIEDPMYPSLVPYILNLNLGAKSLETLQLDTLCRILHNHQENQIQEWIEHYFTPDKNFIDIYLTRLAEWLPHLEAEYIKSLFLVLYKALCLDKRGFMTNKPRFRRLLVDTTEYANSKTEKGQVILETISKLLLRLRMVFNPTLIAASSSGVPKDGIHVQDFALAFLFNLSLSSRLDAYSIFFSDISFIYFMTFNCKKGMGLVDYTKTQSPYVPLFSLFFKTLHQTFIENNKETVRKAAFTLCILATAIEHYSNSSTAPDIAENIFPIFPMIFTFFDSLIVQLSEGTTSSMNMLLENSSQSEGAILAPIILFFLKNICRNQFLNYYELLPSDSRLRFLNFLCKMTNQELVQALYKESPVNTVNELSLTHEITFRIMIFVTYYENSDYTDEKTLHNVFNLILNMILSTKQATDSYGLLFKSLAFFISRNPEKIFKDQTTLLDQLISSSLVLTQRKSYLARVTALGFIIWLIQKEKQYNSSNYLRSSISLEAATCKVFFENEESFIPFFDYVTDQEWIPVFKKMKQLCEKLGHAINSSNYDTKIQGLLDLANIDFKNFPAVRARIFSEIVELHATNGYFASSFIVQWKLCGIIAEVFKTKNQIVDGIPQEGISAFPYIFDEPPIDLSSFPKDSAYLAIESEMFNENYIQQAMQLAIKLCKQAGFNWLISHITEYLFDNLDKKREFMLLKDLYESVSTAYMALDDDETPPVAFSRVYLGKNLSKKFGFEEAIRLSQISNEKDNFELILTSEGGVASQSRVPLTATDPSLTDNSFQIMKVRYDIEELKKMKTMVYVRDIIAENAIGAKSADAIQWNDAFVYRFIYEIDVPLPQVMNFSKITKSRNIKITKHDYYIEKMTKFIDDFKKQADSLISVIPPPKMKSMWAVCPLGLSAKPILNKMAKVLLSSETQLSQDDTQESLNQADKIKRTSYCNFIKKQHYKNRDDDSRTQALARNRAATIKQIPKAKLLEEVPKDIKELSDQIWSMMTDAISLIAQVFELTKPTEEDLQLLESFKKILFIHEEIPTVVAQ